MSAPSSISDRTSNKASMANGRVAVRCSTRPDDSVLFHSLKYTTVDTTNMHTANSQRTLPNVFGSFAICSIFTLYDTIKNIIEKNSRYPKYKNRVFLGNICTDGAITGSQIILYQTFLGKVDIPTPEATLINWFWNDVVSLYLSHSENVTLFKMRCMLKTLKINKNTINNSFMCIHLQCTSWQVQYFMVHDQN